MQWEQDGSNSQFASQNWKSQSIKYYAANSTTTTIMKLSWILDATLLCYAATLATATTEDTITAESQSLRRRRAMRGSSSRSRPSRNRASETTNYRVHYIAGRPNCDLADANEAYKYTILAEDYMVQTNLIVTAADDREAYYNEVIAPLQTEDITVSVPQLNIERTGEEVRDLFVEAIGSRQFAYHIWDQPRVCRNAGGRSFTVYLREYGLVQAAQASDHINVFTTIALTIDGNGLVERLVSNRENTLIDGTFFDGNGP